MPSPIPWDNGASPGVPLYDENTDLSIPVGRGTVADVYDLILDDLDPAVVNGLPALGGAYASERMTQAFGHGLAARVYLSMGDYPNALSRVNTRPGRCAGTEYKRGRLYYGILP